MLLLLFNVEDEENDGKNVADVFIVTVEDDNEYNVVDDHAIAVKNFVNVVVTVVNVGDAKHYDIK